MFDLLFGTVALNETTTISVFIRVSIQSNGNSVYNPVSYQYYNVYCTYLEQLLCMYTIHRL